LTGARSPVPTVSVGLPVRNGENFIEEALRSVVNQTFEDLELIISDNASTDRTQEICCDYVSRDPRIRYARNATNLGALPNFKLVWKCSRGRYFKWLAHDDRIKTSYLEATVSVLEASPEVVLCNTLVEYIDAGGRPLAIYDSALSAAHSPRASDRFAAMVLRSHSCVDIFGLVRRSAMAGSLHGMPFHGADRAFLAQMALRGPLVQLPTRLIQMREHPARYTRRFSSARERVVWHGTEGARGFSAATWRLYREYLHLVRTENLSPAERRRCYAVLARWWGANWNSLRVAADLFDLVFPGAVGFAERQKARLFGAAPGHFHDDM
jgi:glycosyltransferase involved in cell wall biosynthesis